MPALQVRDFPQELYSSLRERAKQEHRSISQQTIIAVREHLSNGCAQRSNVPKNSKFGNATTIDYESTFRREAENEQRTAQDERAEKLRMAFATIDALPKINIPDDFPTPTQIVREMRDER
ncbi:MAG: hypothetical protein LBG97_01670 [Coriobacteriales bacterium]|jgi:plasmid stability protein|nr:hypothetical protein [Coriobacteriales bacterium]